mmetsp:Transcript_39644/g.107198  ORF Transcript_39644/g.107198 Transcript_39644/m.107198 type:complete len:213 (-) Transcript_39644:8-646(-)
MRRGMIQVEQFVTDAEKGNGHTAAWVVDSGVPEGVLDRLDTLRCELPIPAMEMNRRVAQRLFFCDVEGWVKAAIEEAVHGAGLARTRVSPWLRFLQYKTSGARLAAHVDYQWIPGYASAELPGYVGEEEATTHSFLLYLTDCEEGGETLLLDRQGDGREETHAVRAAVRPRRGRLLVFPHGCLHAGAPVARLPKAMLRGDLRLPPARPSPRP